jgi:transposase
VIPANIQDRDCAANLIRKTRHLFPWIAKIFADGGYAGAKLKAALARQPVELEIVKRTDNEGGFKVVRRRWVIERTLSWLRRNRRLMACGFRRLRPGKPIERGHAFRSKAATFSDEGDRAPLPAW